jgi:hypothetical protein
MGADLNGDNKVNSVDFSIMLAFWKTSGPFKNSSVDMNGDGKVNSVDFSILLYQWGKSPVLIKKPNVPESFRVLVKELQSLCLDVELLGEHGVVSATEEREPVIEGELPPVEASPSLLFDDEPVKKKKDKKSSKK